MRKRGEAFTRLEVELIGIKNDLAAASKRLVYVQNCLKGELYQVVSDLISKHILKASLTQKQNITR